MMLVHLVPTKIISIPYTYLNVKIDGLPLPKGRCLCRVHINQYVRTVPSTFQWLYYIYYILNPPTFTTNSTNFPPPTGGNKNPETPSLSQNLCFQAQEIGGDDDLPTTEAFHSVGAEDLEGQETKGDLVVDEVEQVEPGVAQPELSWFDAAILGHLELKFEVWFFFFFWGGVVELSRSGRWEVIFFGGGFPYIFMFCVVLLDF